MFATIRACLSASLLLAALPSATFGLGVHGQHEAEKREIVRLEHEWRAAQLDNNVAALDRLLADDYVGVNITGQVHTKSQLLNRIRTGKLTLSRIDVRELHVRVLGDIAVVRVSAAVEGLNQGAVIEGNFRYTRIYHRLPSGAWKITNFEATRIPSRHGKFSPVQMSRTSPGV